MHEGFAKLEQFDVEAICDIAYATKNNFTGEIIAGYEANVCIVSKKMGQQLEIASKKAAEHGLMLKIFEAYRPLRAAEHFVKWALMPENEALKEKYYPNLTKLEILQNDYILVRSSHSRGAAIDLTLTDKNGAELEMGTIFDFFDAKSNTHNGEISEEASKNRALLCEIMHMSGFVNYDMEWWHFNLKEEPFTEKYFDFSVN